MARPVALPWSGWLRRASLLAILLLATGLRFARIEYQSYWNDEGNSRVLAGSSFAEIVRGAAADIHPPGYYLLLHVWRTGVGESELALRSFSALMSVVLVAGLYRLGRQSGAWSIGAAAAFLGAINPFLIYYAQEARMYSLLAALSVASFLAFQAWWDSWGKSPSRHTIGMASLIYVLTTAAGLYTHYAFPFVLVGQNLACAALLIAHRPPRIWQRLAGWVLLQAGTAILFLPWLPTAFRQLTTWPAAREYHTLSDAFQGVAGYLTLGRTLPAAEAGWTLVATGGLLGLSIIPWKRGLTAWVWLGLPAGLTVGLGLFSEAFSKFLLVAVPPVCWLLALGLTWSPRRWTGAVRLTQVICLGGVLFGTTQSLQNLYFNPVYFRDDYRGIARHLEAIAQSGDAILVVSPNQIQAFEYYHRAGTPIFPLPHSRPADRTETEQALAEIAADHSRVFVLWWGETQADPEHLVADWLSANAFKAGDQWFGQVLVSTYALARPAVTPAISLEARFGESIHLTGYSLTPNPVPAGSILQITLFWKTQAPLSERYKVFAHLYAQPDAPPVAQQDGEPGGGRRLTDTWAVNTLVVDNQGILIPPELPAGSYTLYIGLYSLFTSERLPITLNGISNGDRLELQPIVVTAAP